MALGIALGIAKAGVGAFQIIQGNAAATQGARDAARFGQQIANTRFVNKFAALRAPTRGAELGLQNIARAGQMNIQAAKEGGLRGVIGAAGRTETAMTDAAAKIAAQLDDLQLKIDNKFLTEEQKTELRNKQKDLGLAYSRLQGAQAASAAGANQSLAGLGLALRGLGDVTGGLIERSDLYKGENDGMSRREVRKLEKEMKKDAKKMAPTRGADLSLGSQNIDAPDARLEIQTESITAPTRGQQIVDNVSSTPPAAQLDPIIGQGTTISAPAPTVGGQTIDTSGLSTTPSPQLNEVVNPLSMYPDDMDFYNNNINTTPFNMPQDDTMMQFYMNQYDNAKPNADGLLVTPGLYM